METVEKLLPEDQNLIALVYARTWVNTAVCKGEKFSEALMKAADPIAILKIMEAEDWFVDSTGLAINALEEAGVFYPEFKEYLKEIDEAAGLENIKFVRNMRTDIGARKDNIRKKQESYVIDGRIDATKVFTTLKKIKQKVIDLCDKYAPGGLPWDLVRR